jgi:hypothetical protein
MTAISRFLAVILCLSGGVSAHATECHFMDTFFTQRTLEEFHSGCGYVVVFISRDDPLSVQALDAVTPYVAELHARGVAVVVIDAFSQVATVQDVARLAMRRHSEASYALALDDCFLQQWGIRAPGTVAVLDAAQRACFVGDVDAIDWDLVAQGMPGGVTLSTPKADRPEAAPVAEGPVTYTQHIAPLLRDNCIRCHHEGGNAPFALDNYQAAATRSAMMAEVVRSGLMPPWFAHSPAQPFSNAPPLTREDRLRFQVWHDNARPMGPEVPGEAPSPSARGAFQADIRITSTEVAAIPPEGLSDYYKIMLPAEATEDIWVQGVRVVPTNPRVMHHASLIIVRPSGKAEAWGLPGAPGTPPVIYPEGAAAVWEKGARLMLSMHYEPTGKPETDQPSLEIMLARGRVQRRVHFIDLNDTGIVVPAGAPAYKSQYRHRMDRTFEVIALMPHMHLRGKSQRLFSFEGIASLRELITVPAWKFDWQMIYEFSPGAITLPRGSQLVLECVFDNSPRNPYNPAPHEAATYGMWTRNEMMEVVVTGVDPNERLDIQPDPERALGALRME